MKEAWSLDKRDSKYIESIFPIWDWLYYHYFFVKSDGWSNVPPEKVLIVGSHNGGLAAPDLQMIMYDWYRRFGTERLVYGLMHEKMWEGLPAVAALVQKLGGIAAHPKVAIEAFKKGASVLVFPGGGRDVFRPFDQWNKINFDGRKAFIKLALRENVPILPIISAGAHHTLIVLGDLLPLLRELNKYGIPWPMGTEPEIYPVFLGLPWGIGFGPIYNIPFPVPIYTRVCPLIDLAKEGKASDSNDRDFVDHCYNLVFRTMQHSLDELVEETIYKPAV